MQLLPYFILESAIKVTARRRIVSEAKQVAELRTFGANGQLRKSAHAMRQQPNISPVTSGHAGAF